MKEKARPYTFISAVTATLGSFSFGFQLAIISGVLPLAVKEFMLTSAKEGLLVSTILLGAIFGVFLSGIIADKLGRKPSLQIHAALFIIGTAICATCTSFALLVTGRLISGLALGLVSTLVPLYLSEISPASWRGRIVSGNQIMMAVGILCAYFVNYEMVLSGSWRMMLAVGLLPCTLQFVLLFFIEESPFWLISKGCYDKASFVFTRLRSDALWKESLKQPDSTTSKNLTFFGLIQNKKVLFVILIGMAINMFQQITGINSVLFYSPKILSSSGFSSLQQEILASIGIGLINLICTLIAAVFIDKAGRKKLLIISLMGMFLFLQMMVLSMHFLSSKGAIISLLCMLGYVGSFGVGLGPVCFIIISELYPLSIRGRAMSLAVFANWFFNYLLSLFFPSLVDMIGVKGVFELFVIFIIVALVFVKRLIPETKGKSLAQIEADLM